MRSPLQKRRAVLFTQEAAKLIFFVNYIEEKNMREKGAINKIYTK